MSAGLDSTLLRFNELLINQDQARPKHKVIKLGVVSTPRICTLLEPTLVDFFHSLADNYTEDRQLKIELSAC